MGCLLVHIYQLMCDAIHFHRRRFDVIFKELRMSLSDALGRSRRCITYFWSIRRGMCFLFSRLDACFGSQVSVLEFRQAFAGTLSNQRIGNLKLKWEMSS